MNDFIQLKPQSNVYEAETMVEGYLHLPTNWCFMCMMICYLYISCINSFPHIYSFPLRRDPGWFLL